MGFLGGVGDAFKGAYGSADDQFKSAYGGGGSSQDRPAEPMGARAQVDPQSMQQLQELLGGNRSQGPGNHAMSILEALLDETRRRRRFDSLFQVIRQRGLRMNRGV